jgi:hypothetical protein
MAKDFEQTFLGMAGLKPVNLTPLYSLFPKEEDTDQLGLMDERAVGLLSQGLRDLGASEKVVQEVVGNRDRVQFFATITRIRNREEKT